MNLLKALAKAGSMTFVSRILGFVRDTLIARVFGADVVLLLAALLQLSVTRAVMLRNIWPLL